MYIFICVWLLLAQHIVFEIHSVLYVSVVCSFFNWWVDLHHTPLPQSIYLFCWWNLTVSSFWLLWIKLLWTFVYKSLCGHIFSLPFETSRNRTADLCGRFNFIRNCQTISQRWCDFTFPPAIFENIGCSTTFPTFGIILF